jgi:putative PIN family toxin of toxin-antitoxin system
VKLFLDTNILISAFVTRGATFEVVKACIQKGHTLYVSGYVLKELKKVLTQKFKFTKSEIAEIVTAIKLATQNAPNASLKTRVSRDKKDDPILASAVKIAADCIITGDKDLLTLKEYESIPILLPSEFWRFEGEKMR